MEPSGKLSDSLGWFFTKEEKWLSKWDESQKASSLGMFTQTSSWLKSYLAYGFAYELLIKVDDGENILAGFGSLIVKVGPFRIYLSTWGPFLSDSVYFEESLQQFLNRAGQIGAFIAQINFPFSESGEQWDLILERKNFRVGNPLKKIYNPRDFNLIQLPSYQDDQWESHLLKSFSENARRNIKTGLKLPIKIKRAETLQDTELAYRCFEANAAREGYVIRSWEDVGDSLWDAIQKENSFILLAEFESKIVGAIWCAHGGNMLSYIMGGVDRTEKDLKLGHLLQWSSMLEAVKMNYPFYNISVGGSDGVVRFKSSFYPAEKSAYGAYFFVLKKLPYRVFKSFMPFLEKNKKMVSRILKVLR